MANLLRGFLDNLGSGLTQPKGNLGDFQHAAKLYNTNAHRLTPKTKYLYHVVFNINPQAIKSTSFKEQHLNVINLLVKAVDLPGFKMTVDEVQQYNRKKKVQTKLDYEPVNIVFHDDNMGVTTQLWSLYYGYYFADSAYGGGTSTASSPLNAQGFISGALNAVGLGSLASRATGVSAVPSSTPAPYLRNTFKGADLNKFRYGLDNDSSVPFFTSIQIFQLSRRQYQAYTLVNPIITNWRHEKLDQNDTSTPSTNSMTILYESVIYGQGAVATDSPKGFATDYYDSSPSPLSLLGGGTTSLFGQGGVVSGIGDVLGDLASGKAFSSPGALLGTLVKGSNVVRNAGKLTSSGIRQEGFNILTAGLAASSGRSISALGGVSIPKNNGVGQSQTTVSSSPTDASKNGLTQSQISSLTSNPMALESAFRQAQSTGAVSSSSTVADMVGQLTSGSNPKLNGIANKINSASK